MFQFEGYSLWVEPAQAGALTLLPGWGVHRLSLLLRINAQGSMILQDKLHVIRGELWVADLPGSSGWLGEMAQRWPVATRTFGEHVRLELPISDTQIAGLEKARAGQDLQLRLDLSARQIDGDPWPREFQLPWPVSHAQWAKALENLGTTAFVDVLIPITDVEGRATAARRIREAKKAIDAGDFETAVSKARSALDAVREACNTKTVYGRASKKSPNDRDQDERWAVLIQAAFSLFSGAPHDDAGTTEHFTWSRADAVAAVATAAGLLARLEDLR
ncbi:hypothetical protein [Streptomyces sp. NPDC004589]|uniref:hypothetical protein n=1 Tax=Streptomyces sp. NPDC004589 TaxID=3154553 RepID=UPI0033B642C2